MTATTSVPAGATRIVRTGTPAPTAKLPADASSRTRRQPGGGRPPPRGVVPGRAFRCGRWTMFGAGQYRLVLDAAACRRIRPSGRPRPIGPPCLLLRSSRLDLEEFRPVSRSATDDFPRRLCPRVRHPARQCGRLGSFGPSVGRHDHPQLDSHQPMMILPASCERPLLERFLKAEAMAMWSVRAAQASDVPAHVVTFLRRHETEEQAHLKQFESMLGVQSWEKPSLPRVPRQWEALAVHLYGYETLGLEFASGSFSPRRVSFSRRRLPPWVVGSGTASGDAG